MKKWICKETIWILSGILTVTLLFIGYRLYKENHMQIMSISPNHAVYKTEWELYDDADLVVIGHIETDFKDAKHYYNEETFSFYSVTQLEIDHVIKGKCDQESISLKQPAAIRKYKNRKIKYVIDHYQELKKKNTYVLYLYQEPHQEQSKDIYYHIKGIYYGVYNITNPQEEPRTAEIMKTVLRKYGKLAENISEK